MIMAFDEYMFQRGDLMQFLLSLKLTAVVGDSDAVVDMINAAFIEHLEYLERDDLLAAEFYLSTM
jgi:hypothetical protein|tara:strand:- start:365 stop:559 length:195 start_codon:yes stop_codon:yes gene_type:complete